MPINAAHGNFREPASDDWDIERRLTGPEYGPADGENEFSLRPRNFDEYVGQDAVKENLSVFIAAARERGDCLDHVLLHGPPGLGKTTLSCIIASELGVNLKITSGPAIEKAGDLAALLTTLNRNDVLFIDEIHRLPRAVEEVLYPAMEDFALDLMNSAGRLATPITPDGAAEIARRSRGTPRIANRFLRRVRDFAQVMGDGTVDGPIARKALTALNVDALGLDATDRRMLTTIAKSFSGGPVGLETLAAVIGEESVTLEDVYEPYLLQLGFLNRTPRGRCITPAAYAHIGLRPPRENDGDGQQCLDL